MPIMRVARVGMMPASATNFEALNPAFESLCRFGHWIVHLGRFSTSFVPKNRLGKR
jgi:hypothetical protein